MAATASSFASGAKSYGGQMWTGFKWPFVTIGKAVQAVLLKPGSNLFKHAPILAWSATGLAALALVGTAIRKTDKAASKKEIQAEIDLLAEQAGPLPQAPIAPAPVAQSTEAYKVTPQEKDGLEAQLRTDHAAQEMARRQAQPAQTPQPTAQDAGHLAAAKARTAANGQPLAQL